MEPREGLLRRLATGEVGMSHNRLDWEHLLWAKGHRVTPQRSLVLDAVCEAEGHSTTLGEIYARVRRQDATVDRSTVYRALHLFVQLGIIVSADAGDGEARFEIATPVPHHHLVCRQCGRAQEIESPELIDSFGRIAERYGFRVTTEHLTLFGLCADCQAAETASSNETA
jgi:Fur family transcriptional regulator, ferric uptake regulator